MTTSPEITALRKAGKLAEARALAIEWRASGDDPWKAENALAWVIDSQIKDCLYGVTDHNAALAAQVAAFLREYASLKELKPPSLLHSVILGRALKIFELWPGFLRFTKWWGINNFREEDTAATSRGERTFESLLVRFSRAFLRGAIAASERGELTLDERREVKAIAEENLRRLPDDEWLPFLYGKFLLAMGEFEAAQTHLLQCVRGKPREWWAWTKLAEAYRFRDAERAVIYFSYGLSREHDLGYSRSARIAFAELLAKLGRFDEAASHVRVAKETSDAKGWNAGSALQHLLDADWFLERAGKALPPMASCEAEALALVFDDVPGVIGVIDNLNAEKGLAHVSFADKRDGVLYFSAYPVLENQAVGTLIEAWFFAGQHKPTRVRVLPEMLEVPKFLARIEGVVRRRPDHDFAFLSGTDDVYIAPHMVREHGIQDGEKRTVYAALIKKPKSETRAWRALRVLG